MKKKCISTATLSVLLLVLFLPVFYYIVFYGTNVNYNEMHKIITVEGNKVLSLCAEWLYWGQRTIFCERFLTPDA